jgi:aldose 1-epimerase
MGIQKRPFGKTAEGKPADLFTLANKKGTIADITNFGGIIVSLKVADRNGKLEDITLGYDSIDGYLVQGPYFGAIIGRHGNRIEDAEFELNGVTYQLAKNDGDNHLHGGLKGFDKVLWTAEIISRNGGQALKLTYRSVDGEENYPGNLDVTVVYTLTEENELVIEYHAVTDRDTVVNLTNHAYFNLKGHASGDILDHELYINSDKITVIDNEGIPTGDFRTVKGTPFDFTRLTPIGRGISANDEQIACGNGYDHNWVLNTSGKLTEKAAEVFEPASGRFMEVFTTKPGIQFYSANFLDGSRIGKCNVSYKKRTGLCLETQFFPNAMKHKHFPSPVLKAGEEYKHTTIYKFSSKG